MGLFSWLFGMKSRSEAMPADLPDDLAVLEATTHPSLSLGSEDEHCARRLFAITGSLAHYAESNQKAGDDIRRQIRDIGEGLGESGGRERMERIALRVRRLGATPGSWEALWNGIRGWGEHAKGTQTSEKASGEDRIFLEAPALEPKRAALLQFDAARLKAMVAMLPPGGTHVLAQNGGAGMERFTFAREDLEWAARIAEVLDQADALGNQKRFQEAIGAYKEGLRSAPGFPILLMSLGVCYFRIGDKKKGLRYLQRASELSPNDPRIRKNFDSASNA